LQAGKRKNKFGKKLLKQEFFAVDFLPKKMYNTKMIDEY